MMMMMMTTATTMHLLMIELLHDDDGSDDDDTTSAYRHDLYCNGYCIISMCRSTLDSMLSLRSRWHVTTYANCFHRS